MAGGRDTRKHYARLSSLRLTPSTDPDRYLPRSKLRSLADSKGMVDPALARINKTAILASLLRSIFIQQRVIYP